jgi:FkbM family methyltransferase
MSGDERVESQRRRGADPVRSLRPADAVGSAAQAAFRAARTRWRDLLLRRTNRRRAGPKLLRTFADVYPQAFFIEIGANDGEQADPLRPFVLSRQWRGIMVEPLPHVFERLRRNYGWLERVVLENAAIADEDGTLPIYHVGPPGNGDPEVTPDWYDAIGSLSRETVLRHAVHIPDLEHRIASTEVAVLTFGSLCRKHAVRDIDLILIDTEGYDYEIIKRIDFATHHPRLLIYEHYLLAPEERSECRAHVERLGYAAMEEGFDTWCLDVRPDDAVTRRWHRLQPSLPGFSMDELREWSEGDGERIAGR